MAERLDTGYLRHRRGLRRPVGRGRGRRLRRAGRAGREGQAGRRLPQHRLRALEIADRRRQARPRDRRGATPSAYRLDAADVDFGKVHRHVHDVIAAIAPNDSKERFTGLGVRVIEGAARFKDRDTVVVDDGTEIKARRFVIATGSSPSMPPIPGLDAVPYLTNETIFDLTTRPGASHRHRRGPDRPRAGPGLSPARAPRSRCWKRRSRWRARTANAPTSCSMRSRARAWTFAAA